MHYSMVDGSRCIHISKRPSKNPRNLDDLSGMVGVQGAGAVRLKSLYEINDQLDELGLLHNVNETTLHEKLAEVERFRNERSPVYWLVTARIAELALIVAGAYADGCEFSAAGDLLVNPRNVLIHVKGRRRPIAKWRHGTLSGQLNSTGEPHKRFVRWFKNNAALEISERALIPDLHERLTHSEMIAPSYLVDFKRKMEKIADVIGFLSAWKIRDAGSLVVQTRKASHETRHFVHANLCNFGDAIFNRIGRDIRNIENGLGDPGDLLTPAARQSSVPRSTAAKSGGP